MPVVQLITFAASATLLEDKNVFKGPMEKIAAADGHIV
jgi:hypothetical protein